MSVIPAIDLRDGRVVRLFQGDYARETRYEGDPVDTARRYRDAGATWVHVVDLDAARRGSSQNGRFIAAIAGLAGLAVQCGGGVRSDRDIDELFDYGVSRVVVGSVAIRNPKLVADWIDEEGPDRICVALDTRQDADGSWRLPVHGWTEDSGRTLEALLDSYRALAPLRHVLCTDIARDGMLEGPNLDLYRMIAARWPTLALQASGGVRDLVDVQACITAGATGVIVGKALLDGRIDAAAAFRC